MRRSLLLLTLILAACGGSTRTACPPPPPALTSGPELPEGFPTPAEVTYTSERLAGPSRVVEGVITNDIESAWNDWRAAFTEAPGYDVVKDELESRDAEVNFAGGGTTGQVRLVDRCEGFLNLTIVIRPEI